MPLPGPSTSPRLTVFLPVFNEAAALPAILEDLSARYGNDADVELLVVDDGSSDNSSVVVQQFPHVRLIRHPYNKGQGAAVKTALRFARGRYMVLLDADGQIDPSLLERVVSPLGDYDLVIGWRTPESQTKRLHDIGNAVLAKMASYVAQFDIPDLLCGLRAFDVRLMRQFLGLIPNRFNFEVTSTLCFLSSGYNVRFEPIVTRQRVHGVSSIRPWQDGMRFMAIIFRMSILFHPLRVFAPLSGIVGALGALWGAYALLIHHNGLSVGAMFLLTLGFSIALLGIVSDQIALTRRQIANTLLLDDRRDD